MIKRHAARKAGHAMKPRRRAFWFLVMDALAWAGFFGSKAYLYAVGKAADADDFGPPLESSQWDEERDSW